MIEVHAPHEKIHGFRDFLLHLLTITIGLLIALGLEGCVELVHHHNLRDEATENIRREIQANVRELDIAGQGYEKERANLVHVLDFLEARKNKQPFDVTDLTLSFSVPTMKDANWTTASATGALAYMHYADVEKFAEVYEVQRQYQSLLASTLQDFIGLQSYVAYKFDPAKVDPEEAIRASRDVRYALAHLNATMQVGEGLKKVAAGALH